MEFDPASKKETKEFLVAFIIPLIKATSDEAVEIFANRFGARVILSDWEEELRNENPPRIVCLTKKDIFKRSQEVLTCRDLIRSMILIALLGNQNRPIPCEVESQIPQIEKRINAAMSRDEPQAYWRGASGNFVSFVQTHPFDLLSFTTSLTIRIVTDAFQYRLGIDSEPIKIGLGYSIVGLCPVCGDFFERIRKTKEYCSDKCASAVRMRTYRKRKTI